MLHRNHKTLMVGVFCTLIVPMIGGCPTDGITPGGADITARIAVEDPVLQADGQYSITVTLQSDDDDCEGIIADLRVGIGGGEIRWFDVQKLWSGARHATVYDIPAVDGVRVYGRVALTHPFWFTSRNDDIDETFNLAPRADTPPPHNPPPQSPPPHDKLSGTFAVRQIPYGDGRIVFEQTIQNSWSNGQENVVNYDHRLFLAAFPANSTILIEAWGNGWDFRNEIPRTNNFGDDDGSAPDDDADVAAITVNVNDPTEFGGHLPTKVRVTITIHWDLPGQPGAVTTSAGSGEVQVH